jgi:predicted N-acetyltransferase YhbS
VRIRDARPDEAAGLTELALRSKGHWGYDEGALAVFSRELTLTPADLAEGNARVAEDEGAVVGFSTLSPQSRHLIELQHLFVEPGELRRGIGSALFLDACAAARGLGFSTLVIQSDPNAAAFYKRLGATHLRDIASSIPGRTIPFMTYSLSPDEAP